MKKRLCLLPIVSVIVLLINTNSYCFSEVQPLSPKSLVIVEGYITDCNNGTGISNVLVEATYLLYHYETETDSNGYYSMQVEAGSYDFIYSLLAYQLVEIQDVAVADGNPLTQDVQMCEMPYPVSNVYADPDFNCPGVNISWNLPSGPYTIIYDDNTAEDYNIWTEAGGVVAVKFTPDFYPATVTGGKINVGDGSFPEDGNFLGYDVKIILYDDNGANGMPGSVLEAHFVTVDSYNWIHFENVFNTEISEGDFYIAYEQISGADYSAPIAVDTESPIAYKSYARMPGGDWSISSMQDFMIRAELIGSPGQNSYMKSTDNLITPPQMVRADDIYLSTTYNSIVPGYEKTGNIVYSNRLDRSLDMYNIFRISNFNPDNGDEPEDGDATLLVSQSGTSYYDNSAKSPGFYAYAVEAEYESGDKSPWAYSNIFSCGLDNIVDFTITTCDGEIGDSTEVRLEGLNFPFQNISLPTDTNGNLVFDSVINGSYNIVIVKVGYELTYIDSVEIFSDTSFFYEIDEDKIPARNLFVDSLTAIAQWEAPLIEVLALEDFEDEEFPPPGWETYNYNMEYDSAWVRATGFSYHGWTIPPQKEDSTTSWFSVSDIDENCMYDS